MVFYCLNSSIFDTFYYGTGLCVHERFQMGYTPTLKSVTEAIKDWDFISFVS